MNQIILSGIQITISIWEMWMCYEILYMTVLDKKYADKKETIIRWVNIFVVGSLLGINRLIAFFSRTMLGLVVILTIMCMYGIKRKKVVLSAGIVFVYFEFIAILDFILAFISMEFIKEQFEHVIYIYALTWQKVLIYFFTRGIILLGIVNIKKREESIFTQNVIGQYSTDQWHENIIVFSDTYFQKQWEAMRGDDQEATVLRLFTFSGKRKENAWKELSEYQKECGVKNDSDTRMESYLYGTEEYLIGQKMRVLFSLSSKLFLMMALFISAFFVNGIKILSELSGYERRYEFLRCMGMKQKQRRKTIRFETQMLSDIALFATVMMGIVYVLSYEWRCASKDAGSLDVTFWMYWILIVGIYLLADRLVQWLFAQYVIKRVEKGND